MLHGKPSNCLQSIWVIISRYSCLCVPRTSCPSLHYCTAVRIHFYTQNLHLNITNVHCFPLEYDAVHGGIQVPNFRRNVLHDDDDDDDHHHHHHHHATATSWPSDGPVPPRGSLQIVFIFLQHLQFLLVFNQQHSGNSPIFGVRFSSKVGPPSGFRSKYCKYNLRAVTTLIL